MDPPRRSDGSAGDVDYGAIGGGYASRRRADARIAAFVHRALGDARRILNVGAGAGSYEPVDREVVAVEPSATMRAQRPAHLAPAIDAVAEALPFPDGAFDASLATFTVHQWSDLGRGLAEMRRATRGPALVLTCDPDRLASFWLDEYAPEVIATEARRYPRVEVIASALGARAEVLPVPIPIDCIDGFNEAYYARPDQLLDPAARAACSAWSFLDAAAVARFEDRLRRDLESGAWDRRFGAMRTQPELHGSLVLIVGHRS